MKASWDAQLKPLSIFATFVWIHFTFIMDKGVNCDYDYELIIARSKPFIFFFQTKTMASFNVNVDDVESNVSFTRSKLRHWATKLRKKFPP